MYKYEYKNPVDRGYRRMKISARDHNRIFFKRKTSAVSRWEYYANDKEILLHRYVSAFGIFIVLLMFPVAIFWEGLGNIKETLADYKALFNQKQKGKFSADNCTNASEMYHQFMEVAREVA